MNIGEQIKRYRKEMKLSQKELGERLGVSQQHIAQYENGKRIPKIENIQKIANALDADILDILGDDYYIIEKGIVTNVGMKISKMDESFLINYYRQLNDTGKEEAQKRVGELTLIDAYKSTEKQQVIVEYNPDITPNFSTLNAASPIEDASEENKQHDEE